MAFQSRGIRALVLLQMVELQKLFVTWKKAKRLGVKLPATNDPAYESLDVLMRHPLRSSRGYLTWLCGVLGRPEPAVPDPPEPSAVAAQGAAYLRVLDVAWSRHVAWMSTRTLYSKKVHTSRWGHPMTVEGMLEHALAHPMRHRFQLEELIAKRDRSPKAASERPKRGR